MSDGSKSTAVFVPLSVTSRKKFTAKLHASKDWLRVSRNLKAKEL
jgi:hypothetical protein